MNTYILYGIAFIMLFISLIRDKKKTKMALKKSWKAFENILPQFLGVIMLVGIMLAIINPQVISRIIGEESGVLGVVIASVIGSVTLIPGFVAFPTAEMLIENGAGYMQIGAFISSLMMVGIITMPVEIKYFGNRLTLLRNAFAFIFTFIVAYVIGKVVG